MSDWLVPIVGRLRRRRRWPRSTAAIRRRCWSRRGSLRIAPCGGASQSSRGARLRGKSRLRYIVSPLRRAQSIDGALRVGGFRRGGAANASALARTPPERSGTLACGSRLADRARPARRGRGRDAALRGARWDASGTCIWMLSFKASVSMTSIRRTRRAKADSPRPISAELLRQYRWFCSLALRIQGRYREALALAKEGRVPRSKIVRRGLPRDGYLDAIHRHGSGTSARCRRRIRRDPSSRRRCAGENGHA